MPGGGAPMPGGGAAEGRRPGGSWKAIVCVGVGGAAGALGAGAAGREQLDLRPAGLLGRGPSIDPRTRAPRRASTASTLAAADLVLDAADVGQLLLAVRAGVVRLLAGRAGRRGFLLGVAPPRARGLLPVATRASGSASLAEICEFASFMFSFVLPCWSWICAATSSS
jgi:hypothetical protein